MNHHRADTLSFVALAISLATCNMATAGMNVAAFEGNSRSVRLLEGSRYIPGFGTVLLYFTTYDGSASTFPLNQTLPGNYIAFSAEVRPRGGASGGAVYETDWLNYLAPDVGNPSLLAYGSDVITLPTDDTDGNGLADWCQLNKEANVTFTGTQYQDYPTVKVNTSSGSLLRPAGEFVGIWSVTNSSDGSTIQGNFEVLHISGDVHYQRGTTNSLQLSFKLDNPSFGQQDYYTGTSEFTVLSEDEISVPSFALTEPGGRKLNIIGPLNFHRQGNRYVGNMELYDGVTDTYWRDYVYHVVEITDLNDEDFDGVPDLSDAAYTPANVLSVTRSVDTLTIAWPLVATGFKLQVADSPQPTADWQDVSTSPDTSHGDNEVAIGIGTGSQFFRLKK
ncbi:hypothetical protein GC207_10450 [bacterium]|nr:hypothetical protein [bacterium]